MGALTDQLAPAPTDAAWVREIRTAARTCTPADEALGRSAAVARALEALIAEHRLDGLTLRCFDLLARSTTGCLALSRLADRGVAAGCEGDIPSVIALLWVQLLFGEPGWMSNPASISPSRGEIILAHCTVPGKLVGSFALDSHFESGLGVALAGDMAPGPVTLLRIGGASLDQMLVCEGGIATALHDPSLCRTQVRVNAPREALAELLESPLGNHVVLVRGCREAELRGSHQFVLAGA
jgi:L-fucose isomerase-like protein